MVMGRVLSQVEIDNLLSNLLEDTTVLPGDPVRSTSAELSETLQSTVSETQENIPAGIAAFKAKIAAMQEVKHAESSKAL